MEKKTIIIGSRAVSYLVSPNLRLDQAVVFLPGWQSPADLFCSVMGDQPDLLAVNFPGWPGSEAPQETWGLAEYADFLKIFLERLSIQPAVLIGHSIGAAIAVEYLSRGHQAGKLIMIDGAIIREKTLRVKTWSLGAKLGGWFLPLLGNKARQGLRTRFTSPDDRQAGALRPTYRRLITEDRQAAFRSLRLPITLIWGQDDPDTPLSQAKRLQLLHPDAELQVIPQAGHYCFLDQPAVFKDIMAKLL
ncbi:MAG: alpha/beta hydrolase [Patescibacteria group bacterium]